MDFGVDIPHRRYSYSYIFIYRSNAALQYVSTMAKDKMKDNIMLTQAHEWEESYNYYKANL